MAGRQTLTLSIEVRTLVPQPGFFFNIADIAAGIVRP